MTNPSQSPNSSELPPFIIHEHYPAYPAPEKGSFWGSVGNVLKQAGGYAAQALPYVAKGLNAWSAAEAAAAETYNQGLSYSPIRSTRKPTRVITTQGKTIQALQPREFKPHRLMADTLASLREHDAEQARQRWQNNYHQTPSPMGNTAQFMGLPLPHNPSRQYSQNPNGGDVTTQHSPNMRAILDPAFYEQSASKAPESPPIRLSHREKSDYQEAREIQRRLRLFQQEPTYYDRLMLKRGADVARKIQASSPTLQEQLLKQTQAIGKAALDFLILDDLRTLQDPNAAWWKKGLILASFFPAGRLIKGSRLLVTVVGKGDDVLKLLAKKGLTAKQIKKYKDFVSSRSKDLPVKVYDLPHGGKVFETVMPGKTPGYYAHWEKYINKSGESVIFGKRSYDSQKRFKHWHEYLPFNKLELLTEKEYLIRIQQIVEHHKL